MKLNTSLNKNFQLKFAVSMFICLFLYVVLLKFFNVGISIITTQLYLAFIILILPIFLYRDFLHPFVVYAFIQSLMLLDLAFEASEYYPSLRYLSVSSSEVPSLISESLSLWIVWYLLLFVGFFIGNKVSFSAERKHSDNRFQTNIVNNPTIIALILFVISLLFFVYALFFINNGFSDLLDGMRRRVETYSGLSYIVYFSRLGIFSAVLFLLRGHKKISIITAIISISMISLYGSRGTALILSISYMIAYHYKIKRINFLKLLPFGIVGLVFLQVFGKQRFSGDFRFNVDFQNTLSYAANQKQTGEILPSIIGALKFDQIDFQLGKDFFNVLYAPIPRSLWEGKPQIDESGIIGKLLIGADFWGLPAGSYGWIYLNFWWFGILFFAIFAGFIAAKFYKAAMNNNKINKDYVFLIYVFSVPFIVDIFVTSAQIQILFNILVVTIIYGLDKFITILKGNK